MGADVVTVGGSDSGTELHLLRRMDRASEIAVSMEEGSPPGEQQALAPKNPNKNQGAPPKHDTLKRAASMRGAQKQSRHEQL